ncbi:hypothetical protein VXO80_01910 [Acinetobacter towneri]|uniref:hypothetical protein n=1 Tax=Acinetobacter towneri TaxID=202956 RepID=UPI003A8C7264
MLGSLTSSTSTTPTLDSLLKSLLSGSSLDSSSLTNLISQFSSSNTNLDITSLISKLTQSNGGSFDIASITNLLSGMIGSNAGVSGNVKMTPQQHLKIDPLG